MQGKLRQTIVFMKLQGTFIIEVDYSRYETAAHLILQGARKINVNYSRCETVRNFTKCLRNSGKIC